MGDGHVGGVLIGIVFGLRPKDGQGPAPQLEDHQTHGQDDPGEAFLSLLLEHHIPQKDIDRQRHKGQQDEGDQPQHHRRHGGAEVPGDVPRHAAHEAQAVVEVEGGPAAPLHAEQHRAQPQQNPAGHAGRGLPGQQIQDEEQQQPRRQQQG